MAKLGATTVYGNLTVTNNVSVGGDLLFTSDSRLKHKIELVSERSILDSLVNTEVWKFEYLAAPGEIKLGVMAQDIERNFPGLAGQLVSVDSGDGIDDRRLLKESRLVYVLWAALQEEHSRRSELEERVNRLEEMINKTQ
jgi:hypothetical protein